MAEFARKKRIRGGHRASATKIVRKAEELLAEDSPSTPHLAQIKLSLEEKLAVLKQLDAEILDTVDDEAVAEEIEQSDAYKEDLYAVLVRIEQLSLRRSTPPMTPLVPALPVSTPSVPATSVVTPSVTTPFVLTPSLPITPGSVPSVIASPGTTTSSSAFRASGAVPPSKVRLPKLTIQPFKGELTSWTTFWDSYRAAIDENTLLAEIDKFNYLRSLLQGPAMDAIAGLTLTAANYKAAIAVLKKRFGNKQQIISRHMDALLKADPVVADSNLRALRLYDTVESQVRGLRSLGVASESYGSLLSSILLTKLPQELRLIISRRVGTGNWELERLMEMLEEA